MLVDLFTTLLRIMLQCLGYESESLRYFQFGTCVHLCTALLQVLRLMPRPASVRMVLGKTRRSQAAVARHTVSEFIRCGRRINTAESDTQCHPIDCHSHALTHRHLTAVMTQIQF